MRESGRAFRKRQAARCLYKVHVGHFVPPICISPVQHLRFFGGLCSPGAKTCPPRRLGCGGSACAYPTKDPQRIVKFTSASSDVRNTMRAQGLKAVAEPFAFHDISVPGTPAWAIVSERLAVPPAIPHGPFEGATYCILSYTGAGHRQEKVMARRAVTDPQGFVRDGVKACTRAVYGIKDVHPAGGRFLADILTAWAALARRQISWSDIAPRNVGWSARDGRWKALDLGGFRSYRPRVPTLRGAR